MKSPLTKAAAKEALEGKLLHYFGMTASTEPALSRYRFHQPLRSEMKYKVPLFSAVVFSDRSELKNVEYDPGDCEIMHTSGVNGYLANMRRYMDDALSEEEVDSFYEKLLPYTTVTRQEKEDHVNRILYEQQNMPKCPYCGSNLVIRTATNGPRAGKQFYGCSNYPKCHYHQNID